MKLLLPKLLIWSVFLIISLSGHSQSWQPVGNGTNNSSHGMLVYDGKLVDLGSFNNPCNRVALWNGSSWECLGGGVGIVARAGTIWNGNLVVVGDFWNVQLPCPNCKGIAMWDGTQWTNIGAGFNNDVLCVTVWNGDLVAAGDFTQSNGEPCSRIAKWNGTSWEQIGPDNAFNNDIRAITEFQGELWVGGDFSNVNGCSPCDGVVKWDGVEWVGGNSGVDINGGVDTTVRVLYVSPTDGRLYMGGHFRGLTCNNVYLPGLNGIAAYDGSDWFELGNGVGDNTDDYVRAISEYNGQIVAGGYFTTASGLSANKIARFNLGTETWSAMGQGFDGVGVDEYVKSAAVWNGIFFAGGAYTQAEGGPMNYIAQWYEPPVAAPIAAYNQEQFEICAGECASFTDISTYNPTSWNWSFPGANITSSTAQNPPPICYSTPGTYTISLQACNASGCNTETSTITVSSGTNVVVNNPTVCSGSPTVITANPSVGGGTFLWSTGETTSSITVSPTVNTAYSVTYTSTGCGNATATSNVSVTTAPTLNVNSGSICEGNSITLNATPSIAGGDFDWSPNGESTASITVSPTTTTSYSVSYTLGSCPVVTQITDVTVNPIPTITANDESICTGTSTNLTATPSIPGGSFSWSPSGETTASISVSPTTSTSYTVNYSLNGCDALPATANVTVTPAPTVSVPDQTICSGNSTILTATPSESGGTYSWSPGGETTASISVTPGSNTSYTVNYSISGCPLASDVAMVTVNPTPSVDVNSSTICAGNSATLEAVPSIGGGTYSWNPGGSSGNTIVVSPTTTTTYNVGYTLNGCSANGFGIVSVNPVPTLSTNNETICIGSTVTLTASPSISGGSFSWSPSGETAASISVSPTTSTSYTVNYSLNGCDALPATANVTVTPAPTVSVPDQTICNGNSTILTATPSESGGTYSWSPGGETTASISVTPGSTTSYTVNYSISGCPLASDVAMVTVNPTPSVNVNSSTICAGNSATLEAVPSIGGGTYSWNPGGSSGNTIVVSPTTTTTYNVGYTLNGCSANGSGIVSVNPVPTLSTNNETICIGSTVTLTASPSISGGSFSWSPSGETTASISVSPITSSSYTVNYSLNGCDALPATANVTVTPAPTVSVPDQTICSGISTILTATPSESGGTYSWSPGGETTASISVSPGSTTTYTVNYSISGCPLASDVAMVTVNPTPDNTVTTGPASITSNETSADAYQWLDCNNGNSPIIGETSSVFNPIQDGSYAVQVTIGSCNSTSDCIVFTVDGLNEEQRNEFSIYPNPAMSEAIIQMRDYINNSTIDIYDYSGRIISQHVFSGEQFNLNVKDLDQGIYFIHITDSGIKRLDIVK